MDPSQHMRDLVGAGRGALIGAMFGAGWLGWGLGNAKAFNGLTGPLFGFTTVFLLACSVYAVRKGRRLREQYPAANGPERKTIRNRFLLVVLVEAVATAFASILANRLHRPDLATDWCALIVGLHFLPLARIFHAPRYNVLALLMTLWCLLCWGLFRSNALTISVSLGTGVLLWSSCVSALFRARRIVRGLRDSFVAV